MAGAFVQSKGGQTSTGSSCAVSFTGVVAGNHLACAGIFDGNATLNLVTSTPSATWTNAIPSYQNTNHAVIRLDYSENVASGSWTVTANSNSSTGLTAAGIESSGVATSSSLGAVSAGGTTTGSGTTIQPGSITPTAGSIVIGVVADDGAPGNSADTADAGGQTGNFTCTPAGGPGTCWDSSVNRGGMFYHNNVANVATNPTLTCTSTLSAGSGQIARQAEFLAAASAAVTPPAGPWPRLMPLLAGPI